MPEITNADTIKAWSDVPRELIEQFGEDGDATRRYLLNSIIFELLGDVKNKLIRSAQSRYLRLRDCQYGSHGHSCISTSLAQLHCRAQAAWWVADLAFTPLF